MAIRLGENISSGVIDNSVKGVVTGKLIVEGIFEPIILNLKGNPHPDLAGCILTFTNPSIEMIDPDVGDIIQLEQTGFVGDMSAAEKRRIMNMPLEQFTNATPEEREAGMTWKNILFLEWFSHYNGRVVIEAVDYKWEIDLPRWELTDEDIAEQAEQAKAAMNMHLNFAVEMFQETNEEIRAAEAEIDPNASDEFSWEKRLQESDRRADAFHALMEEARTPEEMEALAELAYGEPEDEYFSEDPDCQGGEEDYIREIYKADAEVARICTTLKGLCKKLIQTGYEAMIGLPEQGDFLSLMVKSQTVADMTASKDSTGFERGFLIAHAKREIARAQRVLSGLTSFEEGGDCNGKTIEEIWKLRELLVDLAGKLRS